MKNSCSFELRAAGSQGIVKFMVLDAPRLLAKVTETVPEIVPSVLKGTRIVARLP